MRTPRLRFFLILIVTLVGCAQSSPREPERIFDGKHAFNSYLVEQTKLGPRPTGSAANRATGDFIITAMKQPGWTIVTQEFEFRGVPIRNIIAKAAPGRGPVVVIGAHYDTRLRADQDKENPEQPVLGANDGASGVAVLLELAYSLDPAKLQNELWLAFLDAEDHGGLSGCIIAPPPCDSAPWPWSVGASYLAENLTTIPQYVIIVDMIGDKDQNIFFEQNSDQALQEELWAIAATKGYSREFIPEFKWSMDDDHTPFLKKGIRAIDMIDFNYPFWHTTRDTPDKCSADSLERVGRVLQTWLDDKQP